MENTEDQLKTPERQSQHSSSKDETSSRRSDTLRFAMDHRRKTSSHFSQSQSVLNIRGSVVTIDQIRHDSTEKYSVRQKLYLVTIVMAKFVHQLCSFWGAIVYPIEAQQRHFTLVEIGFMLVFISIASWCTSIVLSTSFLSFGGKRAAYNLFITGTLGYGLLTISVALSSFCESKIYFGLIFTSLYSIRGMFQALLFSSINAILLSEEFSNIVAFAKALDTLAYTMGSIFSFVLSGFLYDLFGFMWVVIILGSFQSFVSLFFFFLLPRETQNTESVVEKLALGANMSLVKRIVSTPQLLGTLLSHCTVYLSLFYLAPIFTPYLRKTSNLSSSLIGVVACLPYLAMSLSGTLWSFIARTRLLRQLCLITPLMLFGVCSWFSGPDPIISQTPSLASLAAVMFFGGCFLVSNLVLNTPELRDQAEDCGYDPDNLSVSATLASLFTSFEFLGEILGPPLGGYLADAFGERRAFSLGGTIVFAMASVRAAIFIFTYFSLRRRAKQLVRMGSSYI